MHLWHTWTAISTSYDINFSFVDHLRRQKGVDVNYVEALENELKTLLTKYCGAEEADKYLKELKEKYNHVQTLAKEEHDGQSRTDSADN